MKTRATAEHDSGEPTVSYAHLSTDGSFVVSKILVFDLSVVVRALARSLKSYTTVALSSIYTQHNKHVSPVRHPTTTKFAKWDDSRNYRT